MSINTTKHKPYDDGGGGGGDVDDDDDNDGDSNDDEDVVFSCRVFSVIKQPPFLSQPANPEVFWKCCEWNC